MEKRVANYAKKSFLAMLDPAHSVKKVFPNQIDAITEEAGFYLGVKEATSISQAFIESLEAFGYYHHTIDKASHGGRGIDFELKNPLTGRAMTGSSSGTALNVFLGMNDIGVGTDGGGSVLAPALSLNLYSFIHPDLAKSYQKNMESKQSTDGISFTPSIGFISRDLTRLSHLIECLFPTVSKKQQDISICLDDDLLNLTESLAEISQTVTRTHLDNKYRMDRPELIEQLNQILAETDVFISKEGPVDLNGIGDTIFGHFDVGTKEAQINAKKGFVRVVNMVKAMAITVPTSHLSQGYVLIAKNNEGALSKLLIVANFLETREDRLISTYFGKLNHYFECGI